MPKYLTKTFIERAWFHYTPGTTNWQPVVADETHQPDVPLDTQVKDWVEQTGNEIVHPGQLGIHKERFENNLLCITVGLTVLHREPNQGVNPYEPAPGQRAEPVADD